MVLNENKLFFAVNNVLSVLAREKLPGLNIFSKGIDSECVCVFRIVILSSIIQKTNPPIVNDFPK